MGIEHFYWFVDRAVVDPLLGLSWRGFLRKYPWRRHEVEELLAFALEPELEGSALADIVATRTLRWTMKRSTPSYYFLTEIIHHVPAVRRRCPEIWIEQLDDTAVLLAAACEAFLQGRISALTLWAVYNIAGSEDPCNCLQLSRVELARVEQALACAVEKPIFPWQTEEALQDGYRCLRSVDTRRFIRFLAQAWAENWPAPRIRSGAMRESNWTGRTLVRRFRDAGLTRELTRSVKVAHLEKPCALRYFGT
jgi:hypothetical protein